MDDFTVIFSILLLFAPGIAATLIQEWLEPTNGNAKLFIARSIVYTALISILMCMLSVIRGHAQMPFSSLFSTMQNTLKYGIASFILALVVPSALVLLRKLVSGIVDQSKKPRRML